MHPQHHVGTITTRRHPIPSASPRRTRSVLDVPRRAAPSVLQVGGFLAAVGVLVVGAVDAALDTRVVVGADAGPGTSTTVGRVLADVAAGRGPWPPSARWVIAGLLTLPAVLTCALVWSARRRRRPRIASGAVTAPAARRARLRNLLRREGVDALLITDLINLRYLTGFTGSNGALLITADSTGGTEEAGTVFCTDGRYLTQSATQVPDLERVIDRPVDVALLARAVGRVGFEARAVSVAQHGALVGALSDRADPVELTATVDLVEELRVIKDDGEIASLRRACAVADRALAELLAAGGLRPGRTEREVGLDLDQRMRMLGASDPAFETIVAAGVNGAVPHHRPDSTVLAAGDLVTLDFGAVVDGYHSDMTRTLALGRVADWQREVYDLVARSQQAGRDAVLPGASGASIDAISRAVIADAGQGEFFLHGLGHGVGLQVHEAPGLAASATGTMSSGMCVTVEPGVYLAGRGGVRIEDSGVVRPDFYEVLTTTGRDLIQV